MCAKGSKSFTLTFKDTHTYIRTYIFYITLKHFSYIQINNIILKVKKKHTNVRTLKQEEFKLIFTIKEKLSNLLLSLCVPYTLSGSGAAKMVTSLSVRIDGLSSGI